MTEVYEDLTPEGMAAAVELSLLATWTALSACPMLTLETTPEVVRYITGAPFPSLNGILTSRLPEDRADALIEDTLSGFRDRGLPMMWWTGPWSQPADLPQRLEAKGLCEAAREVGMALDLWSLRAMMGKPAGLEIVEVQDAEAYRVSQDVLNRALEIPPEAGDAMYNLVTAPGFWEGSPFRHYLGVMSERPISTVTLSLAGGVAGVYNSGTLPTEHVMGIHTAVTLAALYAAQELEYRVAVVQSSRLAYNAFQRLGFQECCEVAQYAWTP